MNQLFKALNDPTRRRILEILREKDLTAGDISDHFDMSKPSVSHHLEILSHAGLVVSIREGQFIRYSLNTTVMDEMMAWLIQLQTKNKS